ncbi:universal stress protein [Acidimicrobiaceae bacterium AH-315-P05]|nr:universal stress protein [Acidimicrobiaceae bacterium AH-315-P05]
MKDIIVGIDRSVTARWAAETAASLAMAYDANLHLVMCVSRTKPLDISVGTDQFHIDWLSEAEQFLDGLERALPHGSVSRAVGLGEPAKMLCEEAKRLEARAIVVGNRRVQGMSRMLGSVAGEVAKLAPCDVLVANTSGDE